MVTGQADSQPSSTPTASSSAAYSAATFGRDTRQDRLHRRRAVHADERRELYRGTNMTAGAEMKDTDVLYEGDTALVIYGSGATAVVKFPWAPSTCQGDGHPSRRRQAPSTPSTPPPWPSPARATNKALLINHLQGHTPQASISKGLLQLQRCRGPAKDNANRTSLAHHGQQGLQVNCVTSLAGFKYSGSEVASSQALDLKDAAFNPDKLTAEAAGKDLDGDTPSRSSTPRQRGRRVDAGGTYRRGRVNDATYTTGRSVSFTFSVAKPEPKTDGIYVEYNGKLTDAIEKTYDGEDVVRASPSRWSTAEDHDRGRRLQAVYNVKGGKGSRDRRCGEYTLTVKPITFDFNDQQNVVNIKVGRSS
ncbi:MAG: hypothetical protein ACLT98_10775 [Eggerthellaceae bacterium]